MTDRLDISVIIVSHDRPGDLAKMLACLRFQDIGGFETIVVTNTPDAPNSDLTPANTKIIEFQTANIAMARNIGIKAASGNFIAFCDDDALPDPSWLRKLLQPFRDPDIGGVGGFTRGRNGISQQWGAVKTDLIGNTQTIELTKTTVFEPTPDFAPVLIGTNCGFRKSALEHIGGFDEAFSYYLDDSDISLRLSQAGWKLATVPDAQVHHGFAASAQRTAHRVPKSLAQLGQSKAYYCRKHAAESSLSAALSSFRDAHRKSITKLMLLGLLEPTKIKKLINTLETGFKAGKAINLVPQSIGQRPTEVTKPVFTENGQRHIVLAGTKKDRTWLCDKAAQLSAQGEIVTTICLSYSALFMQVRFSKLGFWQHFGGRFGKADRTDPVWRWFDQRHRILAEAKRLSKFRPVDYIAFSAKGDFSSSVSPQTTRMFCLNGYTVINESLKSSNLSTKP